jgi:Transglycosylase-like domain
VSVARRKLLAATSAVGLTLSVVAQGAGSAAQPATSGHGAHARHANQQRTHVHVLTNPSRHFDRSLRSAQRRAERRRASRAAGQGSTSTSGAGYPSPESLGVSTTTLDSIASCESGGDPTAVSADGTYRGKYQFDYGTWASVGGSGDPAAAPEAEQDYRAALLYSRVGSSAWPICG